MGRYNQKIILPFYEKVAIILSAKRKEEPATAYFAPIFFRERGGESIQTDNKGRKCETKSITQMNRKFSFSAHFGPSPTPAV